MAAKVPRSFRLPAGLVERLDEVAEERRCDRTWLVEEALSRYLVTGGEGSGASVSTGATAAGQAPPDPSERVDLAEWLSERTGDPVAVCRAKVSAGRVRVDHAPWTSSEVSRARLERAPVLVDGVVVLGGPAGGS